MEKKYKDNTRTGIIAVTVCIIALVIFRLLLGQWSPDGGGSGNYDTYRGPVLPMTVLSGGEAVTARRHVIFDFSPYADSQTRQVRLTDHYEITNTGTGTAALALAYPFEGTLWQDASCFPSVTVDGTAVETALYSAASSIAPLEDALSWEDYREMMTQNDYLSDAMAEIPHWEDPVVLYRITCQPCESADAANSPYLQISCTPSPEAILWTYRLGSGEDYLTLNYPTADSPWNTGTGYLLVQQGDLAFGSTEGHHSYYPGDSENILEGMSAEITREETIFSEALWLLAQACTVDPQYDSRYSQCPYNTPEILYTGAMARLTEDSYYTGAIAYRTLDDLLLRVLSETALMYRTFSLELTPGETARVDVTFHLRPSTDHGGMGPSSDGYEMATRLGSLLDFSCLSASLSGAEYIQITEQNFGFDPARGITHVELDLEEARYYLKVRRTQ